MKRGRMEVRCAAPDCGKLFEAPSMPYPEFRKLYMKCGWKLRGSITGWHHLCDEHTEEDL